MDITQPLVLSAGSHSPGSGRGCAMNVVAWELGGEISDRPEGTSWTLASVIWRVNDLLACIPVIGSSYERVAVYAIAFEVPAQLAPRLLALAHRTIGTGECEPIDGTFTLSYGFETICVSMAMTLAAERTRLAIDGRREPSDYFMALADALLAQAEAEFDRWDALFRGPAVRAPRIDAVKVDEALTKMYTVA